MTFALPIVSERHPAQVRLLPILAEHSGRHPVFVQLGNPSACARVGKLGYFESSQPVPTRQRRSRSLPEDVTAGETA